MANTKPYSFPIFYACYLLKSAKSLRAYRNYIGSTPNPVRRLRQHNGILAGGARETTAGRPWIMHLLVHGFPSRPAATSFEFAWQTPHRSRFLRDDFGKPIFKKRGTRLEQNILVLQHMIRTHPFSTWPLHIKLFTEEAVQNWDNGLQQHLGHNSVGENRALVVGLGDEEFTKEKKNLNEFNQQQQHYRHHHLLFPPGFTCSIELEGVDGSVGPSGKQQGLRSGREGPLCITDEHFTLPYLAKHTALVAATVNGLKNLHCSICAVPIYDFPINHLGTTLCTHSGCTSVAHLACLAGSWLKTEREVVRRGVYASPWSWPTSFQHHQQQRPLPSSSHSSSSPSLRSPPPAYPEKDPHSLGDLPASGCTPFTTSSALLSSLSSTLPSSTSSHHSSPHAILPSPKALNSGVNSNLYNNNNSNALGNNTKTNVNSGPRSSPVPVSVGTENQKNLPAGVTNPFDLGKGMIPRGGTCPSCEKYTLWGDIVRGCYRRHTGRVVEDDNDNDQEEEEGVKEQEELEEVDTGLVQGKRLKKSNASAEPIARRSRGRPAKSKNLVKAKTTEDKKQKKKAKKKKNSKTTVRLKKVRSKTKCATSTTSARSIATVVAAPGGLTSSRGPGRPKKKMAKSKTTQSGRADDDGGVVVVPKKRGRPRKQ